MFYRRHDQAPLQWKTRTALATDFVGELRSADIRGIHYVTHPTYPAPSGILVVFCQSQIRKIAYVSSFALRGYGGHAAVLVRITQLLFSTVHCATANKRFCPSVS